MVIGISSRAGNKGTVRLNCRFDFNCMREFKELCEPLLRDVAITLIEINMGSVESIDSTALGMLLALRDKANTQKKQIILGDCRGAARQVLEIASFNQLFEMI